MIIGYGKIGRSMPLSLEKCGTLGGDVEMAAVVKTLALRQPQHTFVLIGRNSGERPQDVGLPENVINPWIEWAPKLRARLNATGLNHPNLSTDEQFTCQDIFDELTLSTMLGLDGFVLWAGQHGTTNIPIPSIRDPKTLTKPQDWCAYYVSYLLRAVNLWRDNDPMHREEIWLNADPRNYLKMRDLKWPLRHPVLTQFTYTHNIKHERYCDSTGFNEWSCPKRTPASDDIGPWSVDVASPGSHTSDVWKSQVHNVYSRLEVNGLAPGSPFGDLISYDETWAGRRHFGMFINEARAYVHESRTRKTALRDYALPLDPAFIHGTWSKESQNELGVSITSAPWEDYFPLLHSVRSTMTTPSSGSGWATTKPWEAFAAGTVCFFHPLYDTQNNILGDADSQLQEFLRVDSLETLARRVHALDRDPKAWLWIVREQRKHFMNAISELTYAQMIEQRLSGAQYS